MKKFLALAILSIPLIIFGQTQSTLFPESNLKALVQTYLDEKQTELKLSPTDIKNWMISDYYSNTRTGLTYVYVHQQVNGLRIYNAVSSVAVKDGQIRIFSNRFHTNADKNVNGSRPSLNAEASIRKAAAHLELEFTKAELSSEKKSLNRKFYSIPDLSDEVVRVELLYQPVGEKLMLAWDVNIRPLEGHDWWNIRIDAFTGEVLDKNNWTAHCDFEHEEESDFAAASSVSSSAATYRVFPLPFESPNSGASALVNDPADPIASPFGWHDTDGNAGAEYNITRGNNVYAYDDIADQDAPGTSANGTASLTFDFPANLTQQPSTYLNASLTNLFYMNNMIHDILHNNGFDEAAGNFQSNNYGHGGQGGDHVIAECQDGGGSNNANFATPEDGFNGRMQMYLWTGAIQSNMTINSPASIAGNYSCIPAGFGPSITSPITNNFVLVDDASGVFTDACQAPVNGAALAGRIAVIDRGSCDFVAKVIAAQNSGAIAVVMINNAPGAPFAMGDNGNGGSVSIPSVMISQSDGNIIKNILSMGTTVNGTLNVTPTTAVDIDGSFDNGIIIHEYGHGISNRLTGGPSNSNCLSNGEQGGEGWSDYFGLLLTIKSGDVGTASRGIGTFAQGQPSSGSGIRRFPYSTNMSINPQTYGDLAQSAQVHDIGEIWCATLWEMTWGLIDQLGFSTDWMNGTGGNNVALKLVVEGMKLQPCNPGYLDARDAILEADDLLFGGVHKCIIWEAFAKRGMGFNAVQGSNNVAGDETENFDLPPLCMMPTSAPSADFDADNTTTCLGLVNFTDLSVDIPQQWQWDFGDGNTSTLQNPSHTYSASGIYDVTLIVTNTIGSDTLVRLAYVNVNFPVAPGVSGDTSICEGTATTLTANVSSGNVAEWRDINDSLLFSGSVFNTGILNTTTTYRVIQYVPTAMQNVGPVNNTFGAGGYHNTTFEGRLSFTVIAPLRLVSFWVDATGAAMRTINLYSGSTLIQSIPVMIPAGQSRVAVDIEIPTPGDYQIGVAAGSNLYRNTSGAAYPYTIGGIVSITNSNSTSNPASYYYYLYDWEVQELPCTSPPFPVNVTVDGGPTAGYTFSATGLSVNFTDASLGSPVSFDWDFGNGMTSTLPNPSVTYGADGTYPVTLTVTNANGCQSVFMQQVTVTTVGIDAIAGNSVNVYYSSGSVFIKFDYMPTNAFVRIYDATGKFITGKELKGEISFATPLENIASEFIMVSIEDSGKSFSKRIAIVR